MAWLESFPPYSPDLSPQEQIWAELKRRVGQKCPMSAAGLKQAALESWAEIPVATMNAYVMGMKSSLRKIARE